jgi:hypothetical protein
VKLDGESNQDPSQYNVVQCGLIGGRVDDVRDDLIVEGVAAEREEHNVTPPLVVGR